MPSIREWVSRLIGVVTPNRGDADLQEELRSHLQLAADDRERRGLTAEGAGRHARVHGGGVAQGLEALRDQRGLPWLADLMSDVRFAGRLLVRNPGFTSVVLLTLAFGIGINALVFNVVNAIVFRPLPADHPEQLIFVQPNTAVSGYVSQSYPNYRDLRDRNATLAGLIAYRMSPMNVDVGGSPSRAWGYLATGNYFDLLGVRPTLGRFFHQADDQQPGAAPLAVLSYGFWQLRFLGAPDVVGRTIRINRLPFTVIGVAPRDFVGTELYFRPQVWVPMMMQAQIEVGNPWLERRSTLNLSMVGRLANGVTRAQAESNLNAIAAALAREYPSDDAGLAFALTTPGFAGNAGRAPLEAFSAGLLLLSGLVLLIACVNLASTCAALGADRSREMAIRLSMGASRARVIRLLVTESLMLSIAGGAAAVAVTWLISRALSENRVPIDLPVQLDIRPDVRAFAFTVAASIAAGVLFGLFPARQSTRMDITSALKGLGSVVGRRRWAFREALMLAQVAMCVVLVAACLLSLRGLQQAVTMPIGLDPTNVSIAGFELALAGYDAPKGAAFQRRALEAVQQLPGVEHAAYANTLPLNLDQSSDMVFPDVAPDLRRARGHAVFPYLVSPDFFQTVGISLQRGRVFDAHDTRTTPRVAVVNETFVRRVLSGGNGVGQHFRMGLDARAPSVEVIGVVNDGKYRSLTEDPQPAMFTSTQQRYDSTTTLLVRSTVSADLMVSQIREVLGTLDPALPLYGTGSVNDMLALPLFPNRAAAVALSTFGLLAIVLASTGIHGSVAYAVVRRRREVGIRIALGATRAHVLRLLFGRVCTIVGVGVGVGLGLALVLGPLLTRIVYLASPREPLVLVGVVTVIGLMGVLACWSPASRSLRIAPATALRQD